MKKEKNYKVAPQFITNDKGEKVSVILPIKQYLKMLEVIEENEDIQFYDEVRAKKEKRVSLEDYIKSRKRKHAARKGNYRIIYDVYDKILVVDVIAVGHRKDIYD